MTRNDTDERAFGLAVLHAWRQSEQRICAVDTLQIAAWLEGRLNEAEAAEVEAVLAREPGLLAALLEGGQVQPLAPSAEEIAAARALVLPSVDRRLLTAWLQLHFRPTYALTTAALLIAIGAGGFELGQAMAGMALEQQQASMRALLSDDLSPLDMEG